MQRSCQLVRLGQIVVYLGRHPVRCTINLLVITTVVKNTKSSSKLSSLHLQPHLLPLLKTSIN